MTSEIGRVNFGPTHKRRTLSIVNSHRDARAPSLMQGLHQPYPIARTTNRVECERSKSPHNLQAHC